MRISGTVIKLTFSLTDNSTVDAFLISRGPSDLVYQLLLVAFWVRIIEHHSATMTEGLDVKSSNHSVQGPISSKGAKDDFITVLPKYL